MIQPWDRQRLFPARFKTPPHPSPAVSQTKARTVPHRVGLPHHQLLQTATTRRLITYPTKCRSKGRNEDAPPAPAKTARSSRRCRSRTPRRCSKSASSRRGSSAARTSTKRRRPTKRNHQNVSPSSRPAFRTSEMRCCDRRHRTSRKSSRWRPKRRRRRTPPPNGKRRSTRKDGTPIRDTKLDIYRTRRRLNQAPRRVKRRRRRVCLKWDLFIKGGSSFRACRPSEVWSKVACKCGDIVHRCVHEPSKAIKVISVLDLVLFSVYCQLLFIFKGACKSHSF